MEYEITIGFDDKDRAAVAALYWEAFSAKFTRVLGPDAQALAFLQRAVDPDFVLVARSLAGEILGVAGFKTKDGAFISGTLKDMQSTYGWFGGLWRGALLESLSRPVAPGILLMDGLSVSARARGLGVGTGLLNAIKTHAQALGHRSVRLDVIDTNPRARALYEREGFVAVRTERLGPLTHIFGFSSATQMLWTAG